MSTHYTGTKGTLFKHNSDFSGNINIFVNGKHIEIPATDLLELVAYNYIMPNKIRNIEDMDYRELLNEKT